MSHILITGANRGIGAPLADLYTVTGDSVTATARSGDGYAALDVTNPASVKALANAMSTETVDLLVCNAGIYQDKGQILEDGYPAQMWADTFATNVTGVFLTVQAFLPHLLRSEAPKIAIISSQMGSDTRAPGGSYIYRSSKAAALNLARNLAADLKPEGIAVGAYHPGYVRTDMGGPNGLLTPSEAVSAQLDLIARANPAMSGRFFHISGEDLPW